jgi:cell division protein FtsW
VTYRLDAPLLLVWLALLGLGVVMAASSSIDASKNFLPRHVIYLVLALLAFLSCLILPLDFWRLLSRLALPLALLVCVLVLVLGNETKGATRWIRLGSISLQAGEVVKPLMLTYFAGYLARFGERIADEPMVMVRLLGLFVLVAAPLLLAPDFGTVVVLAATLSGLLFMAGVRLRHFLLVLVVAISALALLAVLEPYRFARLVSFLDPWAQATGSGYQLTQALIAFGRGGLFGLGLGEGIQKLFYLPDAHNDFIFAVIAEELGMVGALSVLTLFALLVLRLLRIARQARAARQEFAAYLCYGIALLLGLQCLVNVGVNTGALPTKGLTLPFVSYGGNSLIVCAMLIGLAFRAELESRRG